MVKFCLPLSLSTVDFFVSFCCFQVELLSFQTFFPIEIFATHCFAVSPLLFGAVEVLYYRKPFAYCIAFGIAQVTETLTILSLTYVYGR